MASSYKQAGVDINAANQMKAGFSAVIEKKNVSLNRRNAFSAIIDAGLKNYRDPVLVLKSEEPGSKQLLAFDRDQVESVCFDMINHLVNDCIVCGATPISIQDVVVCGKLDPAIVSRVVAAVANAAQAQDCFLSGGETSEQPGVLPAGRYILSASIVGVIERDAIVDGSAIAEGDVVLAIQSNGLHTNGYSMVRHLLAADPELAKRDVEGRAFADVILDVHACYYQCLKPLFAQSLLKGAAHITGGGLLENLNRILPDNVDANIDLGLFRPQKIFNIVRQVGKVSDADMLHAFNLGVGMAIVVAPEVADEVIVSLEKRNQSAWTIGKIVEGSGNVTCKSAITWSLS
jgi:phosphoribosylformylglycinamidine cyclo-ligase